MFQKIADKIVDFFFELTEQARARKDANIQAWLQNEQRKLQAANTTIAARESQSKRSARRFP